MRRGEVWTVAGGKDYAGKPRPVVIVQDDSFDATLSVTICAFTTDETVAPLIRLPIKPTERNGLQFVSRVMVDKITTVPKSKLGTLVGKLDDEDIVRLNQAIHTVLRTRPPMLKITRAVAWILVIGLIVIALVPAPLRPGTGVSHNFEHFGSFLLAGILWCLAYADRLLLWLGTSVVFAGGIELLQILMPGRHARFTDFAADALGGCAGLLITFLVTRRYRTSDSPSVPRACRLLSG